MFSSYRQRYRESESAGWEDGAIGKILSHELAQVFIIWSEFKEEDRPREVLQERMQAHIQNIESALKVGAGADDITKKTGRFCQNLFSRFETLWTFLHEEGVEPTFNLNSPAIPP